MQKTKKRPEREQEQVQAPVEKTDEVELTKADFAEIDKLMDDIDALLDSEEQEMLDRKAFRAKIEGWARNQKRLSPRWDQTVEVRDCLGNMMFLTSEEFASMSPCGGCF